MNYIKTIGGVGVARRRRLSALAAGLLLAAQLTSVAHCHQSHSTAQPNAQAELSADNGLCSLCLLAFHFPTNPSLAPSIARPVIEYRAVAVAQAFAQDILHLASCLTRAPPL